MQVDQAPGRLRMRGSQEIPRARFALRDDHNEKEHT